TYGAHGQVDWLTGIPLAVGGLLSISWGVKLAHGLPQRLLRVLFTLFLLLCALLLGLKA
ncbi:MAG TPA: TSUP family transporter, partial [Pseudomonas sp.]